MIMLASNNVTIPPENIDVIIDHLHADPATLRACSLVSRGWVSSSRYHLFSSVTLDNWNGPSFLALLQSPSGPDIGALVQHLSLHTEKALDWFIKSIPVLSSHLQPTALTFDISNYTDPDDFEDDDEYEYGYRENRRRVRKDASVFLNCFPTVTTLHLSIYCDTFLEAAELISSFRSLKKLSLGLLWTQESDTAISPRHLVLPGSIEALSIPSDGESHFIRWLLCHTNPPHPSKLTLDFHVAQAEPVAACLRELGGSLETLSLKSSYGFTEHVTLVHQSNLRSLSIHVWKNAPHIVWRLLSQLSSVSLEEVDFWAWYPTEEPDARDSWSKLDALLSDPQFAGLRRIIIHVNAEHRATIEAELLPQAHTRNVLCFKNQHGSIY
ncbi:hypothetical protein Hypma_013913 [Hypsizygus marmoreus]|uniref:F-box domain-containing protein n=1 Tax=Hypsizygus marmoreus TaxID=39966 RepID=A0A369K925_HYPMA|nr:hypothetical protein Hypma_013913 [Hypsizygus marmoreus]